MKKEVTKWTIHNPDPLAYNEPGKTPNIVISEEQFKFKKNGIRIPGYSIVMYRLEIQ
jgi:hypothetical protein